MRFMMFAGAVAVLFMMFASASRPSGSVLAGEGGYGSNGGSVRGGSSGYSVTIAPVPSYGSSGAAVTRGTPILDGIQARRAARMNHRATRSSRSYGSTGS